MNQVASLFSHWIHFNADLNDDAAITRDSHLRVYYSQVKGHGLFEDTLIWSLSILWHPYSFSDLKRSPICILCHQIKAWGPFLKACFRKVQVMIGHEGGPSLQPVTWVLYVSLIPGLLQISRILCQDWISSFLQLGGRIWQTIPLWNWCHEREANGFWCFRLNNWGTFGLMIQFQARSLSWYHEAVCLPNMASLYLPLKMEHNAIVHIKKAKVPSIHMDNSLCMKTTWSVWMLHGTTLKCSLILPEYFEAEVYHLPSGCLLDEIVSSCWLVVWIKWPPWHKAICFLTES